MRVLIADDDAPARFMLEDMIAEWGYEVTSASDGAEAWERIRDGEPPDLAVLDWEMPEMDGIEVCRAVKADKSLRHVYIVMVTARTSKADIVAGLESGADDFLSKPVDPDELRSRLSVGFRLVQYQHELRATNRALKIFSHAFDHSVQEMIITDASQNITHVNPSFTARYGLTSEEVKGTHGWNSLYASPEDYVDLGFPANQAQRWENEIQNHLTDPHDGKWEGSTVYRTKSGEMVWTQTHISAIHEEDGALIGFLSMPDDITERVKRETAILVECYRAISDLAEARDNETGAHLKRMSGFCTILAQALGLSRKLVHDIAVFAPLHDIGKVGIPDNVLLAPRKLTPEEFDLMKTHATIGYQILKGRETLEMAAEIAWTHHEKFNGKGYPRGIAGEEIPIAGRIVALADVYDALRSRRPYKEPWPHEKVLELIQSEAGQHFDPKVVQAFVSKESEFRLAFDADAGPEA